MKFDCAVIGGGIVGLSVGMALLRKQPGLNVIVLEKEAQLAFHQSGRNSGVIHSGIYYKPGSLKARYARAGNLSMRRFCAEHGIPHEVCGKVIVATRPDELPALEALHRRGMENGIEVIKLSPEAVNEVEPHVRCLQGISVPSTGIVNYREVCATYAELIQSEGGTIRTGAENILRFGGRPNGHVLETALGAIESNFMVNCAGLQSDRIARRAGLDVGARIIPFQRRILRTRSQSARSREGTYLSRPRSIVPISRGAFHPND